MSETLNRRLDRLEERLLPEGPTRCWQIQIWSPEGPINGPVLTWRPGYSGRQCAEEPFKWPQMKSSDVQQHD
jgi:hypothetical protein